MAHLEITSEIGSGPDFNLFWHSSPAQQQQTLETFRRAGATAVFARDKPPTAGASVWKHLPNSNMWVYRF
jgi:hypothetical protein